MGDEPPTSDGIDREILRFFFNRCFDFLLKLVEEEGGDEKDATDLFVETFTAMKKLEETSPVRIDEKSVPYFIRLATEIWMERNKPKTGED